MRSLFAAVLATASAPLESMLRLRLRSRPRWKRCRLLRSGKKGRRSKAKSTRMAPKTKIYFEYGTTTSYGSKTSEVNVGSGTTTLEKAEAISGLSANTLYHYRIVATNSFGTSQGVDKTSTTIGPPTVSGLGAAEVGSSGQEATFKALVDPNGQSTTYQFEYGLSPEALTNLGPIPAGSAGSGYEAVVADYVATSLTAGTKYWLRISATNASGKATSFPVSFMSSYEPGILRGDDQIRHRADRLLQPLHQSRRMRIQPLAGRVLQNCHGN